MRKLVYFSVFVPVAFASIVFKILQMAGYVAPDVRERLWRMLARVPFLAEFGSPVPIWVRHLLPGWVIALLGWALVLLVSRRIYLSAGARSPVVPQSLSGFLYFLTWLPFLSLWLGGFAFGLTILLHAGSGVPAGLVLIPAVLLSGICIALVEVLTLVHRRAPPEFASTVPDARAPAKA